MKKKKGTAEELAKNIGAAAAGAFGGVFLGKFGVVASLATISYGVYKEEPLATIAGASMMTGGAIAGMRSQLGVARMADQSFVEEGKEGVNGFVKGLAQGLWLDRIPMVREKLDLGSIPAAMVMPEPDIAVMAELQEQAQAMQGFAADTIDGLPAQGAGFDQI